MYEDLKMFEQIDLTKCRLCHENDGSIEFFNTILHEKITQCTRIDVSVESEQLPKLICDACDKVLSEFFQFQENCSKVDEQLKQLLSNQKVIVKKPERRRVKSKKTCKKCGETIKYSRHCCKVDQATEDILVKIEPEIPEDEENVLYIRLISDDAATDANLVENEVTIEVDAKTPDEDEDDGIKVEVLEEEFQNSDDDGVDSSEEDFNGRCKQVRKIKEGKKERETFACNFKDCGKTYKSKGGLKKHNYDQHNIRDFLCTICGKNFGRYSGLKAHERIHSATKPYTCTKCNIGFVQAANLRTHIKLHHEGHRYYCTKCGKGFLTSCTLKRHELIHIGKKDFKCDMCSSEFYTRRELIKHKKYHFDIRSHFCSICYKSFVEKHHLTIHMRSHTGERPYVCDVTGCGKSFMESQKLRRHKKNVHRLKV